MNSVSDNYKAVFERVAVVDVDASSALLSGVTTVVMCALVMAVGVSAFQLWSSGEYDEGQAFICVLRSVAMLFVLTAVMLYMRHSA